MITRNSSRRLVGTALCGALLSVFAAAAALADSSAPAVTVRYSDLDLASEQGAVVLYGRIRSAAEGVCSRIDHGDILSGQHARLCVNDSIARAVSVIDSPRLRAVYQAHNGTPLPSPTIAAR